MSILGTLGDIYEKYTPGGMVEKKLRTGRVGQSLGLSAPNVAQASADTSVLDPEKARAQQAYQLWLQQSGNQQFSAPLVQAAHSTGAGDVAMRDPGAAERYSASVVDAPDKVGVTGLSQQANGVAAPAPVAGPVAGAATAGAVGVQDRQGQEIRQHQLGYLNSLESAAAGNGPSVADAAFKEHLGDVTQTQMGIVGQARGNDRAGARREALLGLGRQGQQAALESAQLKAGEQIQARNALGGALSDVRGTDTGVAVKNADLAQGTELTNANNRTDVSKYVAGLKAQVDAGNADRGLAASTFTAGAQNQRDLAGAGLRLDADTGNASRGLQAGEFNAGEKTGAAAGNAANANDMERYRSSLAQSIDTGNVNRTQARNDLNAGFEQGANLANQGSNLTAEQIRNGNAASLRGDALAASGQSLGATEYGLGINRDVALGNAGATNTANTASLGRLNQTIGGVVGGVATGGAGTAVHAASGGIPGGQVGSADNLSDPDGTLPLRTSQALTQAPAPAASRVASAVPAPTSYTTALQAAMAPPGVPPVPNGPTKSYASFLSGADGVDDEQRRRLAGSTQVQRAA